MILFFCPGRYSLLSLMLFMLVSMPVSMRGGDVTSVLCLYCDCIVSDDVVRVFVRGLRFHVTDVIYK